MLKPIPDKDPLFAAAVDQSFQFRVIVVEGDILSMQTDVIVNTAGPSFELEGDIVLMHSFTNSVLVNCI